MNCRKAKTIRRAIYGKGHHPGITTYSWEEYDFGIPQRWMRRIIADLPRRHYQKTKKLMQERQK